MPVICQLCLQPEYVWLYGTADHMTRCHPVARVGASTANGGVNSFLAIPAV